MCKWLFRSISTTASKVKHLLLNPRMGERYDKTRLEKKKKPNTFNYLSEKMTSIEIKL